MSRLPDRPSRWLLAVTLLTAVLLVVFCLPPGGEWWFVLTLWVASAATLGLAGRRPCNGVLGATTLLGLIWIASALKFKYLGVPAIVPDLYYFFTFDTLKVITRYPLLLSALAAAVIGIPVLLRLAWRAEPPLQFHKLPPALRRWARRAGLGLALLALAAGASPHGPFATIYDKPMWQAVNDRSFIVNFVTSFHDTQITIPHSVGPFDPSLQWTATFDNTPIDSIDPNPRPDIVAVLEESTFDPSILRACRGLPLCKRAMFTPDARTLAHGLLGVHTFGGGTWTSEFALITGLSHTLFGNAGLYAPYNLAPRVQFSIARSLKAQGYRVVGLYPTSAEFLNGRNAYRDYGFDQLYDGADLGFGWHVSDQRVFDAFWRLYQQEKTSHPGQPLFFMVLTLHQHGPHMKPLRQLPPPYNQPLFKHQLAKKKALDEWLNLNLGNYLQRNAESDVALRSLESRLLDRPEPTVLLHFGDHQPSFDGAIMALDKTLPADWGNNPHWATYYMLKSNLAAAPRMNYPLLDITYLGGLLLQAGGIPENPYYTANRLLREHCHGRYEECADPKALPSYHDFVFRQLHALGD